MQKENEIEAYLVRQVERFGGRCLKWVSPGCNGVPDRILLYPYGIAAFVETKRPGEKPDKLQLERHKQLRAMGFDVFVVDNKALADKVAGYLHLYAMACIRCKGRGNDDIG